MTRDARLQETCDAQSYTTAYFRTSLKHRLQEYGLDVPWEGEIVVKLEVREWEIEKEGGEWGVKTGNLWRPIIHYRLLSHKFETQVAGIRFRCTMGRGNCGKVGSARVRDRKRGGEWGVKNMGRWLVQVVRAVVCRTCRYRDIVICGVRSQFITNYLISRWWNRESFVTRHSAIMYIMLYHNWHNGSNSSSYSRSSPLQHFWFDSVNFDSAQHSELLHVSHVIRDVWGDLCCAVLHARTRPAPTA